jgi:hypothetical protein
MTNPSASAISASPVSPLPPTAAPQARPEASARPPSAGTPAVPAPGERLRPEPSIRIDPSLGIVVLEMRDPGGATRTIPNERELAAYRQGIKQP